VAPSGVFDFTSPEFPRGRHPDTVAVEDPHTMPGQGESEEPERRSKKPVIVLAAVAVVLAGLGGVWLAGQKAATVNDASPTASAHPVDPVGQVVPVPASVSAVVKGNIVHVTWTNPDPKPLDTFNYRVVDPGVAPVYESTANTWVDVPPLAGKTCVEVMLRRDNGKSSDIVTSCVGG
jgi:hypothetical protein